MEPNDATSTSARAQELRASLTARQEVEALLAEASATRQAAATAADGLVAEAQQLSEALVAESREEADRVLLEARERAQSVLAQAREEGAELTREARAAADAVRLRAEAEADEQRRRVRAEVTEQVHRELEVHHRAELARLHQRHQAVIGDLEASVRAVSAALAGTTSNVGEMLGALDALRTHTAESLGEPVTAPARPQLATGTPAGARDHLFRPTIAEVDADRPAEVDQPAAARVAALAAAELEAETGVEPGTEVDPRDPAYAELAALEAIVAAEEAVDDQPPLTATEAFLRSAHIDHQDPPLPPMDQGEIGARYARDAMRATARSRRQDEETLDVVPEPRGARRAVGPEEREAKPARAAHADAGAKPLGWLFRS